MEGFDPAINYGPNDAGISALTIVLGIVGVIAISWLFGKIYEKAANFCQKWHSKYPNIGRYFKPDDFCYYLTYISYDHKIRRCIYSK